MAVNVTGSLAIGFLAGLLGTAEAGQNIRLFLITGILGGYTTFSAFSLDALTLWERGAQLQAGLYVLGSVIVSLAAAAAGLILARMA
jgi:CrcB protein